jgi:imidazolonepropionase
MVWGEGMITFHNARIETLDPANPFATHLVVEGGEIIYVGNNPPHTSDSIDLHNALVTPALIDCHTHLIYGGNRAREFEMRLEGASYEEIAKAGGGIRFTVKATREASDDELFSSAHKRALKLMSEGVATFEIKSGYGLDYETERRMLLTARALANALNIDIKTTYLAAHALPLEFQGRADDYIKASNQWMVRLAKEGLIDAVDAFCEGIGFSLAQTQSVFEQAKALNLPVKLHAEQLSNLNGAALAARYNALSADHLEYLDEAGVMAMAKANTVAVLLPAAYYFIRETQKPPVALLRQYGVKIALATDHNPGSSPILSPLLVMNMAATLFRMTPAECLKAFTVNAAHALGFHDRGVLKAGMRADFAVWDCNTSNELTYFMGHNPLKALYIKGEKR